MPQLGTKIQWACISMSFLDLLPVVQRFRSRHGRRPGIRLSMLQKAPKYSDCPYRKPLSQHFELRLEDLSSHIRIAVSKVNDDMGIRLVTDRAGQWNYKRVALNHCIRSELQPALHNFLPAAQIQKVIIKRVPLFRRRE